MAGGSKVAGFATTGGRILPLNREIEQNRYSNIGISFAITRVEGGDASSLYGKAWDEKP